MIRFLLPLLTLSIFIYSSAEAGEFYFKNNKFTYDGYIIHSGLNVSASNFGTESGPLASAIKNTFNTQEILKIISPGGKMELWLFDKRSDKKLYKIDTLGTEFSVTWSSPEYIEVTRSQMGQAVSYLYQVNPIELPFRKTRPIGNILSFDPASGYIIRYSPPGLKHEDDRVVVERIFSDYKKEFSIKMKYTYLSDAIFQFEDTHIKDGILYVRLDQENSTRTFQYNINEKEGTSQDKSTNQ